MSAFILTSDGVSGMAQGKPFSASETHPNYAEILAELKASRFDRIHDLINISRQIAVQVEGQFSDDRVKVCPEAGVITFDGHEISNVLVDRIIKMLADGFNVRPMVEFLKNVMQLPKAVADRIYEWIEAGKMPITEDGCFIAYKRVNSELKSFYDGKTEHVIGGTVSLPRSLCDDNQHNTCSSGLHFCSQGYLPQYHGGQGRVLVLKVNPKDVVAIPFEYGTSKGRACKYEIVNELLDMPRERVEVPETPALPQPVIETKDLEQASKVTKSFVDGYQVGYAAGKNKSDQNKGNFLLNGEWNRGYEEGYKDGRGHKAKRFKV